MATTMEQVRAWRGPALWSYGFRPFFLAAGLWALITIAVWVPWYLGHISLPSAFAPLDWHIHELLFGYVPAVVAGFLLTAVPNWTGRLPVVGWRLIALFSLWMLGRLAMASSALLPSWLVAAASLSFLVALAATAAREIVAGKNHRNLRIVVLVSLLAVAQIAFHVEAAITGQTVFAPRFGIAAVILLISVVGGRIIPSFTTNWLMRQPAGVMPKQFSRYDGATLAISAIALVLWGALPALPAVLADAVSGVLALSGLMQGWRLIRWAPQRTGAEALVWVLHLGYAFIPLGFLLAGHAVMWDNVGAHQAAVHAWTAGAIGLMTLAVMTRATRGHTGYPLTAPPGTVTLYIAIALAALLRIAAALLPDAMVMLLNVSGALWVAGFVLFVALYGPMLVRPRG
ncbi:MAG: NnrS family protein [Rhizobiales bacterium]|nr:NnrS family protein [Hyphomicrobiales bacterium]